MRPSSATAAPASPELGVRIRERREDRRLSQREAAKQIGVDRRAYQGWEAGTSGITWENLDRLAEVLGASADWVRLGDEGLEAIVAARRRGPQPAATRAANAIEEVRQLLADPPAESDAFVVNALRDIAGRLERIETALGVATPSAGGRPPGPGGELGRRLQEPQTSEQGPAQRDSGRGKGARRGSGR